MAYRLADYVCPITSPLMKMFRFLRSYTNWICHFDILLPRASQHFPHAPICMDCNQNTTAKFIQWSNRIIINSISRSRSGNEFLIAAGADVICYSRKHWSVEAIPPTIIKVYWFYCHLRFLVCKPCTANKFLIRFSSREMKLINDLLMSALI